MQNSDLYTIPLVMRPLISEEVNILSLYRLFDYGGDLVP